MTDGGTNHHRNLVHFDVKSNRAALRFESVSRSPYLWLPIASQNSRSRMSAPSAASPSNQFPYTPHLMTPGGAEMNARIKDLAHSDPLAITERNSSVESPETRRHLTRPLTRVRRPEISVSSPVKWPWTSCVTNQDVRPFSVGGTSPGSPTSLTKKRTHWYRQGQTNVAGAGPARNSA